MTECRDRVNDPDFYRPGVCILGYLRSATGLGQAARNLSYAADAVRIPLSLRDVQALAGSLPDGGLPTKCCLVADRRATIQDSQRSPEAG